MSEATVVTESTGEGKMTAKGVAIIIFISVLVVTAEVVILKISDSRTFQNFFHVQVSASRSEKQKAVINGLLAAKQKHIALEVEIKSLQDEEDKINNSAVETVANLATKSNLLQNLNIKYQEKKKLNESLCSMNESANKFGFSDEVSAVNPPCEPGWGP